MTSVTPEDLLPEGLESALLSLLKSTPAGIDEFSLIKQLAARFPDSLFAEPGALRDSLKLFRLHFLLFHVLYKLADRLAGEGMDLGINAMRIALAPSVRTEPALRLNDPLRAYYLDWDQWAGTHAEDVERLLDAFWSGRGGVDDKEVEQALALFELDKAADARQIKARYRMLMSLHHPDRGGNTEVVQGINQAFIILKRYYGKA